ncbi:hypothetical protein EMPG_14060 [Blastomyces silverae]|uniref:DUF1275 domain-containing protein n=1 Tax=Blastomyces silverae TaxID=2060906 RepID=A0A0H1BGC6_9EURO|nr:hypothetical protein EMPG_14060 [Blastomyces silverae]
MDPGNMHVCNAGKCVRASCMLIPTGDTKALFYSSDGGDFKAIAEGRPLNIRMAIAQQQNELPNCGNHISPPISHIMNSKELSVQFSPAVPNAQEDRDFSKPRRSENDLPHLSRNSSFTFVDPESCIPNLPWHRRLSDHLKEEVDPAWSDLLLLACSFASGVIDSLAFKAWGSFANMQTGNIVFLALGVSGEPEPTLRWPKCLIAIAAFLLGILFFIHGSRLLNPLRRSTLITSFTIQTLAILLASTLVQTGLVHHHQQPAHGSAPNAGPDPGPGRIAWMQMIPISLLAFQAGGQIITSRLLKMDEESANRLVWCIVCGRDGVGSAI